jgi:pre-mRNA-splicing factor SYF1
MERRRDVRGSSPIDPARKDVNNCYERALVFMHKMPRIWIDYLEFLTEQRLITRVRRTFDAALQVSSMTVS